MPSEGVLLRIFINETDQYQGHNLYEVIVAKAQQLNLAGATVFRGIMGYQAGHELQSAKILRLSENLPLVIEIVDTRKNIELILPFLNKVVEEGLITTEKAHIFKYTQKKISH